MHYWAILLLFLTTASSTGIKTERKKVFNLTVKITQIKNTKGVIEVGLFNNAARYAQVGGTCRKIRKSVNGKELVCTFYDLPEARYGVCIYHDENSNNRCDKNFFGIPTEAYAFSNNVRPVLSAPTFGECSFLLNGHRTINIKMVY